MPRFEQILDITIARRELEIEPHRMLDGHGREAVTSAR
jgi:hypothetical protein